MFSNRYLETVASLQLFLKTLQISIEGNLMINECLFKFCNMKLHLKLRLSEVCSWL